MVSGNSVNKHFSFTNEFKLFSFLLFKGGGVGGGGGGGGGSP